LSDFIYHFRGLMIRSLTFSKLPKFLTFKGLPEPFNQLMRPLVLVSVGLHAALLLAPIPSPPVKPKPAQPKTVKITTLPPLKSKRLVTNKLPGKALLKPRLSPVVHKGLVIHRPTKKPIIKVTQAHNQKTPKPQNTPQTVPSIQPVPTGGASSDPSNPMSDFPHYPGESEGCLNVSGCFETHKPIDVVSKYFQEQLPLKKFTVTPVVNDEADRKVYQISKGGAQQFLNILVPDGKTAVYVLAEKAMTVGDLQNAVQIPPDFTENIMASLPDGTAVESAEPFATPNDFFTNPGGVEADGPNKGMDINPEQNPEIDSMKLVSSQTPQQLFSGFFAPQLTQSGYQPPKPVATYGGGQLYELKKGTSKPFYLNLVPAKDGKGTVVVVWRSKPA
jgi:hypothetical protein